MINFKCQCGKSYSVNDNLVGRTANCQQCGQKIIVPSASQPDESNSFTVPVPPIQQTAPAPPPPADLFCTNCGNMISEQAFACMSCGAKPIGHKKFCRQCGVALNPEQIVCIQCGAALTGGFRMGSGFAANQNQPLLPIILAGLLVLLFFTPQLIVRFQASSQRGSGIMGGFYDPEVNETVLIWGWNSWFGIVTLVLGCLILAGKVAEYSLPNINKFPQQLYAGLYGIVAFCLLIGLVFGYFGGYGIWVSVSGKTISLYEALKLIEDRRGGTMLVFPATVVFMLGVSVFSILQSLLSFAMKSRSRLFVLIGFGMLIPYLLLGYRPPFASLWILFDPILPFMPVIVDFLCKTIFILGVVFGHRGLKSNERGIAIVLFLSCIVCCIIHLLRNLYWLPMNSLPQFCGLLCLIALILGVFFGHRELKTNNAIFAKDGLWLCWIVCLIYIVVLLLFPSLGWFFYKH